MPLLLLGQGKAYFPFPHAVPGEPQDSVNLAKYVNEAGQMVVFILLNKYTGGRQPYRRQCCSHLAEGGGPVWPEAFPQSNAASSAPEGRQRTVTKGTLGETISCTPSTGNLRKR